LDEIFCKDDEVRPDFTEYISEFGRSVDLEPLKAVLDEAYGKFEPNSDRSDAWLAPRVHATLRMTRREAADRRLWDFLAVVACPEYVRWRWGGKETTPRARFVGEQNKNAFGRLWWGAELTRNGSDYGSTVEAFKNSRFSVVWVPLDLAHNRAFALGAIDLLEKFNEGSAATGDEADALAKIINLQATTRFLDETACPPLDAEAMREWREMKPDETKMMTSEPIGPDDDRVLDDEVVAVSGLLSQMAAGINLKQVVARRRAAPPVDVSREDEPAV
jgi:hypothetical protein